MLKRILTTAFAGAIAFASVVALNPTVVKADFDAAGEYDAYMGLQTPGWSFRNAWDDKDYGVESDVWNQVTGWDAENNPVAREGKINDVKIKGNGTYRVGVTELGDWCATEVGEGTFNLLFVSTNIPLVDDVKVTDVKLVIDGSVKHTDAEAFLDPDATDYVKILVQNIWNADKKEISFYQAPTKSVEIEFTVSGFSYDNEEQKQTTTEAPTTKAPATDDKKDDGGEDKGGSMLPIIIAVVVVVVIAVVAAVVVLGKKKK